MITKIYYDKDKGVRYISDTGPLPPENNLNNNEFSFSRFSGNAEYYIVHTENGRQICEKRYEGRFENGKYNGQGKLTYASGAVYNGNFENGKPNGFGKLTGANGNVCKGRFEDGKIVEGKVIYKNGSVHKEYEGEFNDNKFNGQGTLYGNQLRFRGQFNNGKKMSGISY